MKIEFTHVYLFWGLVYLKGTKVGWVGR